MDHIVSNVAQGFQQAVDASQNPATAQHLVVLIHGLWGNPVHLNHLRDTLAQEHQNEGLYIFVPKSNADTHTYDGIEVGAERVTNEIEREIEKIDQAGGKLRKISVTGYSLGGLVARYVVGLLYSNGLFDRLQPTNFTTFASPHLGVRTPKLGYRAQTWNYLGSRTLSTSGQQMFLVDSFRTTGKPLLSVMADPNSVFVKGLAMFKNRTIYSNTINDRSVPYYTSAISRTDPFVDLEAIETHPLPGQPEDMPVILDPENPVSPRTSKTLKQYTFQERIQQTRESLPFYAFLFGIIPLAVPLFLLNAGYQTYQSARRVRLHEGGSTLDLKRYRIPLLEETQGLQDKIVEHLATSSTERKGGEDYLPTPPPEPSATSSQTSLQSVPSFTSSTANLGQAQKAKTEGPWPILALTEGQFEMIESLDSHVNFTKYRVHIQKVRHTHAAIIVRMQKETFGEGRVVVGHWARGFAV